MNTALTVILFGLLSSAYTQDAELLKIKNEMITMLPSFLNDWYPATLDTQYGGYFCDFSYDWKNTGPNNKFIVSQARLLWTASKAAKIYTDTRYRVAADHGFVFLRDKMWDKEEGGFYTLLTREGNIPSDGYRDEKRLYGNSFAIYGLAEYYNLTGNLEALELAQKTFLWLDAHAHDSIFGGYYQFLLRSGIPFGTDYPSKAPDDPGKQAGFKDYNSGIHLLEALSALYQVWSDNLLRTRLLEVFYLTRDTMTNQKGELQLFFYPNWVSFKYNSDEEAKQYNYELSHVTFGHNIETAYLLLDADDALGKIEYQVTLEKTKIMVDSAVKDSFDTDGGFPDSGYYFSGNSTPTIVYPEKVWWTQAEGLHSLLLFYTLFPENTKYRSTFIQQWEYIKQYIIDPEFGGWFSEGLDKSPDSKTQPKGEMWKVNYHDGRSMMNCVLLIN